MAVAAKHKFRVPLEMCGCRTSRGDHLRCNIAYDYEYLENVLGLSLLLSRNAFILSDGESYVARNGLDSVFSVIGNEISGHFRLKLRGHTKGRIPFNAVWIKSGNGLNSFRILVR